MNQAAPPAIPVNLDRSLVKISVLAVSEIGAAFAFGWIFSRYFDGDGRWIALAAAAALIFSVIFVLGVFFVKSRTRQALVIFLVSAAVFTPFYSLVSPLFFTGFVIFFLMLLAADAAGRRLLDNMLVIRFFAVAKRVLPRVVTALAFFAVLVYYLFLPPGGFFVSEKSFEKFFETVPFGSFGLDFDPAAPAGEFIRNIAASQTSGDLRLEALPPAVKAALMAEAESSVLKQAADLLGTEIDPARSFVDNFYEAAKARFFAAPPEVQKIAVLVFVALLFLTIKGIGIPFYLLAAFLAFLVYEIFLALGFATLALENRNREIVVF